MRYVSLFSRPATESVTVAFADVTTILPSLTVQPLDAITLESTVVVESVGSVVATEVDAASSSLSTTPWRRASWRSSMDIDSYCERVMTLGNAMPRESVVSPW